MKELEQLYQQYFKDVYLYAKSLAGEEQLAQDVTSETFLKAIEAVDRFRGDCDVRVWLCQIAKHTYFSYPAQAQKRAIMRIPSFCRKKLETPGQEDQVTRPGRFHAPPSNPSPTFRTLSGGVLFAGIQRTEFSPDWSAVWQDGKLGLRYLLPGQKQA